MLCLANWTLKLIDFPSGQIADLPKLRVCATIVAIFIKMYFLLFFASSESGGRYEKGQLFLEKEK